MLALHNSIDRPDSSVRSVTRRQPALATSTAFEGPAAPVASNQRGYGRPVSEPRPTADLATVGTASPTRALALATISFTISFAAWGLIGGLASVFSGLYRLTASQTALLVAVPVLLGSLARLPMGILTDRFGGRASSALLGSPRSPPSSYR